LTVTILVRDTRRSILAVVLPPLRVLSGRRNGFLPDRVRLLAAVPSEKGSRVACFGGKLVEWGCLPLSRALGPDHALDIQSDYVSLGGMSEPRSTVHMDDSGNVAPL